MLGDNSPKDIDIEVYGLSLGDVNFQVMHHANGHKVNAVGASFGVLKCRMGSCDVDVSLPRLDNKVAGGHKGFVVDMQSDLSVKEAAARRDFTMNSLAYDPIEDKIIDEYDGQFDIRILRLKHTSDAFMEDPLRVLRGMQFAGRFNMAIAQDLAIECQKIVGSCSELPVERVWVEWEKWASKSQFPHRGLELLRDTAWIYNFSEIAALQSVPQDAEWHPEGDVYYHTCWVCDAMAEICNREDIQGEDRAVLMFAALCHDMGKPATTEIVDGRWRAPKHATVGVPIAKEFLESIGAPKKIVDRVLPLVGEHMAHISMEIGKRSVRRLSIRLQPATINELSLLVEADMSGRPPLPQENNPRMLEIVEVAKELAIEADVPKPIVTGKHLLAAGFKPGPEMGKMLRFLFEMQLEGEFDSVDGAMDKFFPML
jgi:tRNA nucleotidyltransferase (CCA-adding enzyme)